MLPRVDAVAARAKDGSIWMALTNVDPTEAVTIDLATTGTYATAVTGQQLTGEAVNSVNTFDKARQVAPKPYRSDASQGMLPIRLPAKSVTVIRLNSASR